MALGALDSRLSVKFTVWTLEILVNPLDFYPSVQKFPVKALLFTARVPCRRLLNYMVQLWLFEKKLENPVSELADLFTSNFLVGVTLLVLARRDGQRITLLKGKRRLS